MELGLILGRNLEKPGKRQNLGVFRGFSRFNFLFLPFSRLFQVFQVFQVTWQPWSWRQNQLNSSNRLIEALPFLPYHREFSTKKHTIRKYTVEAEAAVTINRFDRQSTRLHRNRLEDVEIVE